MHPGSGAEAAPGVSHIICAHACVCGREKIGASRGIRGWRGVLVMVVVGGGDLTGRALSYLPKVVSHLTLRPSRQVGEMHALCRYSAGGPTAAAYRWVTCTAGL